MSYPVLTNLDLNGNQLLNAKTQLLASDPGSPQDGDHWINTTTWTLKYRLNGTTLEVALGPITSAMIANGAITNEDINASAAIDRSKLDFGSGLVNADIATSAAIARSKLSFGTGLVNADIAAAAAIARSKLDFGTGLVNADIAAAAAIAESKLSLASDAAAGTASRRSLGTGATQAMPGNTRLDTIAAPTGPVALNNQKITGLADGTAATDAATVGQVQSASAGLDAKPSVRVASTANVALTGTQTIDGVALVAGNRVLLKDQTAPAENGIWVVAAGAWARATDMDNWAEVPGAFVFVEEGTANADTGWLVTANAGGTLGTTAIGWTKFTAASVSVISKYSADITGNAAATQFTVTHNLGTTDVQISVYDVSNDLEILVDKKRPTTNTVRIDFATAPANGKVYRVVVIG